MAEVTFHHPLIPTDLQISVKPDEIRWAYGLNTAVYPTYGGEVVQILSVYFDDMQVSGTISTVAELEHIYGWFITYMQYATQGRDHPSYDQHPVDFYYPERGWHFQIWPRALPGFKYGREIVAPTWKLVAAVKEPDATFADQIKDYAAFNLAHAKEFSTFGVATADFGTTGDLVNNPFASINADPAKKGQSITQYIAGQAQKLGDIFDGFVQDYQNHDLTKLPQFALASKAPAKNVTGPAPGTSATKAPTQKQGTIHR